MTLCVAAIGQEIPYGSCIVTCFDKRGETSFTSSQTEVKLRYLGGYWFALFAGDICQANELLDLYKEHLRDKEFREAELVDELSKPAAAMREKLVERYVRSHFSMSYREFLSLGSQFPKNIFRDACQRITEIELDCELIILGFAEKKAQLFTVSSDGYVSTDDWLAFTAIGSGSTLAEAWMHYREHQQIMPIERTICHVYEAKRFGDRAPGVGEKTELVVINTEELKYMQVPPMGSTLLQEELDGVWKKYGPKDTFGVKVNVSFLVQGFGYPPRLKGPPDAAG
jgi:20S proteasome alpha/beta subunit